MLESGANDSEQIQIDPFDIGKGHMTHGTVLRLALVRWSGQGEGSAYFFWTIYVNSMFGKALGWVFLPHASSDKNRRLGNDVAIGIPVFWKMGYPYSVVDLALCEVASKSTTFS